MPLCNFCFSGVPICHSSSAHDTVIYPHTPLKCHSFFNFYLYSYSVSQELLYPLCQILGRRLSLSPWETNSEVEFVCRKCTGEWTIAVNSKESRMELKEELKCYVVELKASVYPKGNSRTEIAFQSFITQRQKEGLQVNGQSLMWSVPWKWMSFEQGSSLQLKAISGERYSWEPSAATTPKTCRGRSTFIIKGGHRKHTIGAHQSKCQEVQCMPLSHLGQPLL